MGIQNTFLKHCGDSSSIYKALPEPSIQCGLIQITPDKHKLHTAWSCRRLPRVCVKVSRKISVCALYNEAAVAARDAEDALEPKDVVCVLCKQVALNPGTERLEVHILVVMPQADRANVACVGMLRL